MSLLAMQPGCYVEATGGMYAVTGANNAGWRVAPGFGVSVGVAYDAFVGRASIGAGGEAVHTRIANADNLMVIGPYVGRIDLSPARIGTRGLFRIAFGAAWGQQSQRFRTAPDGSGVVEGRPAQALQAFVMPSTGWILGGGRTSHFLMLDLAMGPAGIVMWDNVGLTNLYGIGGETRVTLSLPLGYSEGLSIGAGLEAWSAFMSTPEMRARVREEISRGEAAHLEEWRQRMEREAGQGAVSTCPSGSYHRNTSGNLECSR